MLSLQFERVEMLREAFRLHQNELKPTVEMVLVARPSIAGRRLADVEKDFLAAARNGRLLIDYRAGQLAGVVPNTVLLQQWSMEPMTELQALFAAAGVHALAAARGLKW